MNDDTPQRLVRRYRRGRAHHLENTVMSVLARVGVVPHSYLLTTVGRRTGRSRSNPVTVVEHDGHLWLVAPYGAVPWVHNARAAGRVELTRRFATRPYTVDEACACRRPRSREVGGGRVGHPQLFPGGTRCARRSVRGRSRPASRFPAHRDPVSRRRRGDRGRGECSQVMSL